MKRLIRRWERREYPVLNMMFHSSELLAGASPYTPTEASVVRFLERIHSTLSYAIDRGWQPCLYEDLPAHFPRTDP
tara:strand:- start:504 stop:731 length:228 start_codon:yes stop_codon:yes gene_type:complete